MIGLTYIYEGNYPDIPTGSGALLPDNLDQATLWKFSAVSHAVAPLPKTSFPQSNAMAAKVSRICKHLEEGMDFLDAQGRALHEIIHAVEGVGQLVMKREASHFPRTPESRLQSEFEILLGQIEVVRRQTHFGKPMFGNSGTPPLRIHTSLATNPRYEEVHLADLEALHLRMIYWGKVSGDGPKGLIGRETVDMGLKHLMEMVLRSRSQRDRLKHIHSELSKYLGKKEGEASHQVQAPGQPGIFQTVKDKLLGTKGKRTAKG